MSHYKQGIGRCGLGKTTKIDDFREMHEWKLKEYGDSPHKIITTIPFKEYYVLGELCIKNEVSLAGLVRELIREKIDSKSIKVYKKSMKKVVRNVKKKGKSGFVQGSLF